jgi:hypothetical protein
VHKYTAHLASVSRTDAKTRNITDSLFGPNHPLRMELDHACAELEPPCSERQATMTDLLGVTFASPDVATRIGTYTVDAQSPTPPLPSVGAAVPEVRLTIEPPGLNIMPLSATLNRESLLLTLPVPLTPTTLSLFWRWRDMLVASPYSSTCCDPMQTVHGFFESLLVDITLNRREVLRAGRIIEKDEPLGLAHCLVLAMSVIIRFGVPTASSWRSRYRRRVADSWFVCTCLHSGIGNPVCLDPITLRDLTLPGTPPDATPDTLPDAETLDSSASVLSRYTYPARHARSVAVLTPIIGAESAEFLVTMHDTLCVVSQEDDAQGEPRRATRRA